jgi:hypothetical protein
MMGTWMDTEMKCGAFGTYVWKDEEGKVHVRAMTLEECIKMKDFDEENLPEGYSIQKSEEG